MPFSSFRLNQLRAVQGTVAGSLLSNAAECPQSASASFDPIRPSAGSGRSDRATPHLPSFFGQQQSSETERGDGRKKKRQNGKGIQSRAVITAAAKEGRKKRQKDLFDGFRLRQMAVRSCVCCVCGGGRKADRSRSSKKIGHHGDGRRGRRPKRKQQEETIVFFFECFKRKCKRSVFLVWQSARAELGPISS